MFRHWYPPTERGKVIIFQEHDQSTFIEDIPSYIEDRKSHEEGDIPLFHKVHHQ